jgi:1-aminocyclopropane-1-carboxylate deaminase/D-cysteine desulfhydrase-like pyridoxal-dependent ACC family enzyme
VARLVVAVGSGTTLLGLLRGFRYRGESIPILGVMVGRDPSVELDKCAPYWRKQTTLERSPVPYHSPAKKTELFGRWFDPHYEAKCLPYLQRGDCLVVVSVRPRRERQRRPGTGEHDNQ